MSRATRDEAVAAGRMRIPRSRGAASGFLVILLGLWGALVPFVGPAFDFAYNPALGSGWSAARGWLEVLPGVVAVIGGLILVRSGNRAAAMLGGWLSVIAGGWLVVGRVVATTLTIGEIGRPVASTDTKAAWLELTYFYGLGALIVFLGAMALGRLSVRSVRDVGYARRAAEARASEQHVDDRVGARTEDRVDDDVTTHIPTADTRRPSTDVERVRTWRDRLSGRRNDPTPTPVTH
ncbi:hypothetical protein [Mycolicibacterium sp. 050158]|uniref:hypothetical protein n=1 Tax=Mycolicibacterium sp. 050158 TaxID=3090602 RepID=UPI00299F20C0|nr:hypothetical protein [Mycolicibacterium sp. 050158]MDX1890855.1 hypothetical protein [Mycolicibacterium sp. 050158]